MDGFAIGVDVGGTSSRALVVDADGTVAGRGAAGGGNPNSHPPEVAAARVAEAVSTALAGRQARACVLAMAGASKLSDPAIAEIFHSALAGVGVRARVVTDAEAAFASGTPSPHGTVLIAGTGSIAMRIVDRARAGTVGGFGWLLGDEGSAFWIGREAVRATLYELQHGDDLGPLATAVLAAAVPDGDNLFARLITAVKAVAPIELATFAPLVSAHVDDPAAGDIVRRAAASLAAQAKAADSGGPIVLAGAVLAADNPVGALVREILAESHRVTSAQDGSTGAAWLAALDAFGPDAVRPKS
ncbi:MAG: N-acetylglucosamine kinase [Actinomycetota bacterium]|nr:N-acetylglucosamine kinase [Actinomycetota bacterium]